MKRSAILLVAMFVLLLMPTNGCSVSGSARLSVDGTIYGQQVVGNFRIRWGEPAPLPTGSVQCGSIDIDGVTVLVFRDPDGNKWICVPGTTNPYNQIVSVDPLPGLRPNPGMGIPLPLPGPFGLPLGQVAPGSVTLGAVVALAEGYQAGIPLMRIQDGYITLDLDQDVATLTFAMPAGEKVFIDPDELPFAIDDWSTKLLRDRSLLIRVSGTVNAVLGYAAEQGIARASFDDPLIGRINVKVYPDLRLVFFRDDAGELVDEEYRPVRAIYNER